MWSEQPLVKEGILITKNAKQKLGRNKWKNSYVRLVQGYVLVFKRTSDVEPGKVYMLSDCNILKDTGNTKKENSFIIETHDETRLFACDDKEGYFEWIKQLEAMKQQFPSGDDAVVPKNKRASMMAKAKKNIAGKVVSSSMGRDALKSILDEETRANFGLLKHLLVSAFGEEKATELEADIVKLVVKGHFAHENKLLDSSCMPQLRDLLKKCCYLLTGAFQTTVDSTKRQVLERAVQVIAEARAGIEKTMKPALTPKNFSKIGTVFESVGSIEFLQNAYILDENRATVSGLNEAMRKFLLER